MRFRSKTNRPAFTVIELIVLVGVILLLALVLIPSTGKSRRKADLMNCANNLKQVGLGFRLWTADGDGYPMLVSTNNGGTLEMSNDVWRTFLVLSNELKTPKLLLCPADTRTAVTSWASLANTNISYFVCLEADETLPDMPLSGDRNLTNNQPLKNHVLTVTTNSGLAWTRALHDGCGNIGFSDGSVQSIPVEQTEDKVAQSLKSRAEQFALLTNKPPFFLRLAMPE